MSDSTPPVEPTSDAPVDPAAEAPVKAARKSRAKAAPAPATEPAVEPAVEPAAEAVPEPVVVAPVAAKRTVPVKLLVAILVPLLVIGAAAGWVATHQQYITDQQNVWAFESTDALDKYTDDSTMTDHAMFLFQASKPRIAADSEFDDICGDAKGGDGAVGCYTYKTKRIVLFEIADDRLSGLEDAVAAHQMLHAAWDRMSESEREPIEDLIDDEVERLEDDEAFTDELENYRFDDDDERRYDELHSILATEQSGLSDELEEYYAQYFTDREVIVDLFTDANNVLIEIAAKVEALEDQIDALSDEILTMQSNYDADWEVLDADWEAFKARNEAYFYHSQAAFDADQNALFDRAHALDAVYDEIDAKYDEYNSLLIDLTELDTEAADLFGAINLSPRESGLL